MRKLLKALGCAATGLALTACVSIPTEGAPPSPSVPTATPSAVSTAPFEVRDIEFGDWGRDDPQDIQARFSRSVGQAVGRGESLNEALSAMRANSFGCNPVTGGRAADRPVQLCERQIRQNGCTHTWQVSLFDPERRDRVDVARAIYDQVCAGQPGSGGGLLGAPPG